MKINKNYFFNKIEFDRKMYFLLHIMDIIIKKSNTSVSN